MSDGTYINLAPTASGYRDMKRLFQENVQLHRMDIERLEKLRTWLLDEDDQGPRPHVAELTLHLDAMFDDKVSELEGHITTLEGGIAELERCGY